MRATPWTGRAGVLNRFHPPPPSCRRDNIDVPGGTFRMQFSFTDEQEDFRGILRRFFTARSPSTEVRKLMATGTGWDRDGWKKLNQELGLTAVHIPEEYGGQGFGCVELAIVLEEMGRALVCAPYFSSVVLGATAILNAGTDAQKRKLLPPIAAGDTLATLAFTEDNGLWDSTGVTLTATGNKLNGTKSFVVDGHTADLIVVLARQPGTSGDNGLSFYTVRGDAPGLKRTPLKSMDDTRKLARLEFKDVEGELLGEAGKGAAAFARTMTQATICLANEMAGGADKLRETTLEYVQMRMQFGRPLAAFQSMKHKQADMLVEVETAKSAAYYAAAAFDANADDLAMATALAKAAASDTYLQTGIHAIQCRGGIGFTWDEDTHLWFKRAKSSEVFLGDANYHRELMMRQLAA
jgi:alkylation response protein AidB-like acyl-CoA dehydrogenase